MLHLRESSRIREVTAEQAKLLSQSCHVAIKQAADGRWFAYLMLLGGRTERLVDRLTHPVQHLSGRGWSKSFMFNPPKL